MKQNQTPKWQQQVEEILRKQFPKPDVSALIRIVKELTDLANGVEVPSGDTGEVVALILKSASKELRPLAAIYAGFQLGAAYEKYQNANRARN